MPDQYYRYVGWLMWMGDISLEWLLPIGCDGALTPSSRLLFDGLIPLLIVVLGMMCTVCLGVAWHVFPGKAATPQARLGAVMVAVLERSLNWAIRPAKTVGSGLSCPPLWL